MKKLLKTDNGITLVALVVTIIVLIILAAVLINLVIGDNGIIIKTQEGAIKSEIARENEALQMTLGELRLSNKGKLLFDEEKLKEAVERNAKEDVTVTKSENDKYIVTFTKSGREYEVIPDEGMKTLVSQVKPEHYGDSVAYSVKVGDVTLDNWKIFYNDGSNVIMIYGDYLPNSTGIAATAGLTTKGTVEMYSDTSRADLIDKLTNPDNWSSLITNDLNGKATAKGAVDLETWVDSWNDKGYMQLYINPQAGMGDGLTGYRIGTSENPTTYDQNVGNDEGYKDSLYFPHRDAVNNCYSYWIASPCGGNSTTGVLHIHYIGNVEASTYNSGSRGIRPVIYLSSSVLGEYDKTTETWNIE